LKYIRKKPFRREMNREQRYSVIENAEIGEGATIYDQERGQRQIIYKLEYADAARFIAIMGGEGDSVKK